MHKITALALLTIVFGLSTVVVLRNTFSAKKIDIAYSEETMTSGVPEKMYVPVMVKEERKEPDKSYTPKTTTSSYVKDLPNNNFKLYKTDDFSFIFDKKMILTNEYFDLGETYLTFENFDSSGYVQFYARTGREFKKIMNTPKYELGFYDWDKHFFEFRDKVLKKSTKLDDFERIITINRFTFLERIYFHIEGGNYEINYTTYDSGTEYIFSYNFPAAWYPEYYAYAEENRSEIRQQIFDRTIPDKKISERIEQFEKMLHTFKK
jgi:hypothetical protein